MCCRADQCCIQDHSVGLRAELSFRYASALAKDKPSTNQMHGQYYAVDKVKASAKGLEEEVALARYSTKGEVIGGGKSYQAQPQWSSIQSTSLILWQVENDGKPK